MEIMNDKLHIWLVCTFALLLAACSGQRVMMPTPNVYVDSDTDVYAGLHQSLKSTEVPLFYITDRQPEKDENGNLVYGYQRSPSLAFGNTVVDLGEDITWEQLLEASRTNKRLDDVKMEIRELNEIARGPNAPIPYTEVDGKIVEDPDLLAQRTATGEVFRQAIVQQLALTPRKEVFIFVHGFHNDFNDAAFAMAELWHFLGRIGVPIIYTWPAGHPGLFGYTYDRESSEFTVYHLRQTINFLSSFPEVEKIHLIAHSRGTDVAVNAMRELTIAARAAGLDPKEKYKIHNFVLAAPDIDRQVAQQRIIGDHLAHSAHRFTIYTSPADKAIGWSDLLFDSPKGRIGNVGVEEIPETTKVALERSNANFAYVNFWSATDKSDSDADTFGHSYFRDAPTVSSDLILMLRDDLDPGPPGRPLENLGFKFWRVPPGYPARHSEP
jgi:esterase/lipase superfamily enzyme